MQVTLQRCGSLRSENFSKELALFDRSDVNAAPVVTKTLAGGGVFVVEVAVIYGALS